ncbi:hypothetical protein M407DRAFT_26938 [Tulasnella calospora MUT 4182]|uniref:Protein kinase domain-containing protein n=1 Tax=Tulasnella calospora MUT 4182 TaxID=1051891 RepID=A0A0C3QDA7_9AGAM|nr:hypothetical protein M407DRAFT_26938 [Tulasnella calospora MUT 4182]
MFKSPHKRIWTWISRVLQGPRRRINITRHLGVGHLSNHKLGEGYQQPKGISRLARDLLATLSERRIEIAKIKFGQTGFHSSGANGDVAVATLVLDESGLAAQEELRVAVKKIRFNDEIDKERVLKAFVIELRVLNRLAHPHIVKITGFVEDIENGIAWLVFPWEENGNVREFLRSGEWDIPERVSLINDVAAGLEYLHSRSFPVCHGDLKSLNILVNNTYHAVITDFGSARMMREVNKVGKDEQVTPMKYADPQGDQSCQLGLSVSGNQLTLTGPKWSFRWAAPEVLSGHDPKVPSDIWAFGWICWEIITDNYPFPETDAPRLIALMVVRGQLPPIDAHDPLSQIRSLCSIMLECWKPEPNERPSVQECQRSLQWIPSSMPAPKSVGKSGLRSAALLMQLGELHRTQDRNEEASKMFEQGLAVARSTSDKAAMAGITLRLGHIHRVQSKYSEAEESYSQALEIYTSIGDSLGRATALLVLGHVHRDRLKYAEAEKFYAQAQEDFTSIGDDLGQGHVLRAFGDTLQARSKHIQAEELYGQALAAYTKAGSDWGRANTLLGLGRIHRARSKYAEAKESCTQALEIDTSIGNDFGRADALLGLGDTHQAWSNYAEAEQSYVQALELFTSITNPFGRADAFLGLGDTHHARLEYDGAEECYSQALDIYRSIANGLGQANALRGLGDIHQARLKYPEAGESYTQALAIYKSIEDDFGTANSFLGLGKLRISQARYAEAKSLIAEAAEIADRLDYQLARECPGKLLVEAIEAENSVAEVRPPTFMASNATPKDPAKTASSLRANDPNRRPLVPSLAWTRGDLPSAK